MPAPRETIAALIQARMSSRRLPGKVLKPMAGRAILEHVVEAARTALPGSPVIVATSTDPTDDAVAEFCVEKQISVSRGPLDDVVLRLQGALKGTKTEAFFRICADSPFYDPDLMRAALAIYDATKPQLVTNVFPRSFPKGRSVELAEAKSFLALDSAKLSSEEREHVFAHYYAHPERFRIENFRNDRDDSKVNLCIDTEEDWSRAERFLKDTSKPSHAFSLKELREPFAEESHG